MMKHIDLIAPLTYDSQDRNTFSVMNTINKTTSDNLRARGSSTRCPSRDLTNLSARQTKKMTKGARHIAHTP